LGGLVSNGEALFVIPANLTRPFFTHLYTACEQKIFDAFTDTFQLRPVIRSVTRQANEFDAQAVAQILEREFALSDRIELLVVVPTDSVALSRGVADVCRKKGVPVVALTLPFYGWPIDRHAHYRRPPTVACDSAKAMGQLALAAIAEFHLRSGTSRPANVVVMPGSLTRTDSRNRIASFVRHLKHHGVILAEPHFTQPANWQRSTAKVIMQEILRTRSDPIDIVFAASDEQALGCRAAVLESLRSDPPSRIAADCIIFGFDAIGEARSLILENDYHFRGTVEQRLPEMAEKLLDVIQRLLRGDKDICSLNEVEPECIIAEVATTATEGERALKDYPQVRPLDPTSQAWTSESTAKIENGVQSSTMRKYRERGESRMDGQGRVGRDQHGRIWRHEKSTGKYFYLTCTLRGPWKKNSRELPFRAESNP
jgi:ABC-type sugar transport system substrate-binding protein